MKSALKAAGATLPETFVKAICGSIAVGAASATLLVVGLLHPPAFAIIAYGLIPVVVAFAAGGILTIIRLRVVGRLPSGCDASVFPRALLPWIQGLLLVRFGLLGSVGLILLAGVAVGIAKRDLLGPVIEAFVFLAWCRVASDVVLHTTANAGVILRRR